MLFSPRLLLTAATLAFFLLASAPVRADDLLPVSPDAAKSTLTKIHKQLQADNSGKVADYIPALGKADPKHFGLAIVTADGQSFTAGDTGVPFAIESISKVFALALALEDAGRQAILDNVGVYHTGLPFNSIIASDVRQVKLQNPFVNVGAITTTSFGAAALITGAVLLGLGGREDGEVRTRGRDRQVRVRPTASGVSVCF